MRVYDSIISLDGHCAVAMQLARRNLRPRAFGLDWAGNPYEVGFVSRLEYGFRNDFRDFCLPENLVPAEFAGFSGMRDRLYQTYFPHNFKMVDGQPKTLRRDCRVVKKRIDRMLTTIRRSRTVLFIMCTYYEFDLAVARSLLATVRAVFPEVEISMRVVQLHAKTAPFGTDVGENGLELYRYERESDDRDVSGDMPEWAFMDDLRLSGAVKIGSSWKHLLSDKLRSWFG